jgi:hypothetical protein
MANSFTLPTSGAGAIPSPDAVVAGKTIEAETVGKLTELVNFTHAHLGCSPVVSQGYVDTFAVTGTPADYNCLWRIPVPSNAHSTLVLLVKAKLNVASSAGSIVFEEQTNSNSATINITTTSSTWYRQTLSVGAQAGEYLELQATAISAGLGTIIEYISVHWEPLTSPLAAGVVAAKHTGASDITPLGATRSSADYPLSSARGVGLTYTLDELAHRPRVLFAWSGLQRVTSARAPKTMLPDYFREFSPLVRAWGGSRDRDHRYEAHVFAATHGNGDDRRIVFRTQSETITAATVVPAWITPLSALEPFQRDSMSDQADTDLIRTGLTLPPEDNVAPASPVWSVTIWGP